MGDECRSDPSVDANRFEAIFEHAPSAMLAVDLDGSLILVNAETQRIFGFERDELLGRQVDMLAPTDERRELRRVLLSPMGPLPPRSACTVVARRKNGQCMMLELESRLIELGEAPIVLATVLDITERVAVESRLSAAVHEKSLLVSEVHHRVNNNLQVICSLLELQKAKLDDRQLIEILNDCLARVVSMALVHQAICQAPNVARVDFRYFLEMLIVRLRERHDAFGEHVPFEFDAVDLQLTMDRAMPCGLASNELLANALRQSVQSRAALKMSLTARSGSTGCLSLQCIAPARPLCPPHESGEFSRSLIELLVAQAHGRLRVDGDPAASWEFVFPIDVN